MQALDIANNPQRKELKEGDIRNHHVVEPIKMPVPPVKKKRKKLFDPLSTSNILKMINRRKSMVKASL